jgi:hypothetical protein
VDGIYCLAGDEQHFSVTIFKSLLIIRAENVDSLLQFPPSWVGKSEIISLSVEVSFTTCVSLTGHTIEDRLESICERFQGQRYERRVSRKVSNFTSLNAWVFVVSCLCMNLV